MIDVLIVGAGPTGLLAAIELTRLGLTCQLIDQLPAASCESRALAIQARTLELFHHLMIVDPFLKEGVIIKEANLFSQRKRLARIDLSQIDSPYPFVLSLEQSKTESILSSYAASIGIRVERACKLLSLSQQTQSVTATISRLNHQETVVAKWVIGCDGAHSIVRKSLNLPFNGQPLPTIFSLADVSLQWSLPHDSLFSFFHQKGTLFAIPLPGEGRYRLIFQLKPHLNKDPTLPPTLGEIEERVKEAVCNEAKVYNPTWTSNFHVHSRMTYPFRIGRVFLAGDSAHIHSPFGGQGMNGGLQDIDNLAWKLNLVHKNQAPEKILDTYTEERSFVAKKVLRNTEKVTKISMVEHKALISLRNHLLLLFAKIPSIQRKIVEAISQTGISYSKNSLILGKCAGKRAPNISIGKTDLYTLCGSRTTHHLLLVSKGNKEEELFSDVINQFEKKAKPIFITVNDRFILGRPLRGVDEIYLVKRATIYLLRPDMYIGAVATPNNLRTIEDYFNICTTPNPNKTRGN